MFYQIMCTPLNDKPKEIQDLLKGLYSEIQQSMD